MADPDTNDAAPADQPKGFPFATALATLATLFVFVGLVVLAYNSPNYLDEPKDQKVEPKADPAAKLDEVKARNEAALGGVGAKMSLRDAHGKMLATVKQPTDKMPFPTPEPPVAPPTPKKDDKEKKP